MSEPVATVKAYRRKGGAVVTVTRAGRPKRRYVVSLRRYAALREWTLTRGPAWNRPGWKASGAWMRGSIDVALWPV